MSQESWRRCSSCKEPIAFETTYWVCNVSTCNRKRTGLIFCDVSCWDAHLSSVNHRESWAVEKRAPSRAQWKAEQSASAEEGADSRPRRRIVARPAAASAAPAGPPREVLIIASRLKSYVQARGGMNTSDGVMPALSELVRELCDQAIESARRDGRKTVMERDLPAGGTR